MTELNFIILRSLSEYTNNIAKEYNRKGRAYRSDVGTATFLVEI